jgi:hypothetical protein
MPDSDRQYLFGIFIGAITPSGRTHPSSVGLFGWSPHFEKSLVVLLVRKMAGADPGATPLRPDTSISDRRIPNGLHEKHGNVERIH